MGENAENRMKKAQEKLTDIADGRLEADAWTDSDENDYITEFGKDYEAWGITEEMFDEEKQREQQRIDDNKKEGKDSESSDDWSNGFVTFDTLLQQNNHTVSEPQGQE